MRRFRVSGWLIVLIVLIAAALFVAVASRLAASTLLYPPRAEVSQNPATAGFRYNWENIRMQAEDGVTLEGWFLAPPPIINNTTVEMGATIIYLHDWGESRDEMLPLAVALYQQGYGALLFDQRAHGMSQGDRATFGLLERSDVYTALDALNQKVSVVNQDRIAVYGRGMGAAAAILAAADYPQIRAVIAESPYTAADEAFRARVGASAGLLSFPFAPLAWIWASAELGTGINEVRPIDRIDEISPRAVLLLHGQQDTITPVNDSFRLYAVSQDPADFMRFPESGHGDLYSMYPEIWGRHVKDFLDQYVRNISPEPS